MKGLKTQILYHERKNYIYENVYIQNTKSERELTVFGLNEMLYMYFGIQLGRNPRNNNIMKMDLMTFIFKIINICNFIFSVQYLYINFRL
jgi:hypothetical protein